MPVAAASALPGKTIRHGKGQESILLPQLRLRSPQMVGTLPSCGEWNTFTEEVIARESGGGPETVQPT